MTVILKKPETGETVSVKTGFRWNILLFSWLVGLPVLLKRFYIAWAAVIFSFILLCAAFACAYYWFEYYAPYYIPPWKAAEAEKIADLIFGGVLVICLYIGGAAVLWSFWRRIRFIYLFFFPCGLSLPPCFIMAKEVKGSL